MKITNVKQVDSFLDVVNRCRGDVYLRSGTNEDFCLNLKSRLSQYVAIANMVGDHSDDLELFCALKDDEPLFLEFFNHNPDVLNGYAEG